MTTEPILASDEAAHAIGALLPVLAELADAAVSITASSQIVVRADELAVVLREAAVLADAVKIIERRARP